MIIGIPSAVGGLVGKGVAKAPQAIIQQLQFIRSQQGATALAFKEVPANPLDIAETFDHIERAAQTAGRGTCFLGGDHSVTYPLIKGLAKDASFALVIFDAHPDCVHDFSPPTQEDFVRVLLEEKIIMPQQVFLVGLRSFFPPEKRFLDEKKVRYYTMDAINDLGMQEIMDLLTEQLLPFKTLYCSIDIDCVDPAFAPGVDYPEPGGLTSRELLYALRRLSALKSFSYLDIVEVNPEKDNGQTAWLAAKLLSALIPAD